MPANLPNICSINTQEYTANYQWPPTVKRKKATGGRQRNAAKGHNESQLGVAKQIGTEKAEPVPGNERLSDREGQMIILIITLAEQRQ